MLECSFAPPFSPPPPPHTHTSTCSHNFASSFTDPPTCSHSLTHSPTHPLAPTRSLTAMRPTSFGSLLITCTPPWNPLLNVPLPRPPARIIAWMTGKRHQRAHSERFAICKQRQKNAQLALVESRMCVHTRARVCVCVCVYVCYAREKLHAHVRFHTHTHALMHTHARTHTHIHSLNHASTHTGKHLQPRVT
jgi:hypothetical protein